MNIPRDKPLIYFSMGSSAHKVNTIVDLAVLHGGEVTVQTACYSGKPFIGIGLRPEQEANIEYCVKYGNAVRIKRKDISVKKLSNTIENVLSNSKMKERAIEIKKVFSNYDGVKMQQILSLRISRFDWSERNEREDIY